MKCFKSRELCTEASSRAGFGSRLKTWTAEEQQSEKCGACLLCALCCVRGPEALGFPRGPSKTNASTLIETVLTNKSQENKPALALHKKVKTAFKSESKI